MLAVSCATSMITISVLEPATVNLPGSIQKLSIFPEAGIQEPPGTFSRLRVITLDSSLNTAEVKKGYLHGIYDIMSVSPRFQKVVIADSAFENYTRKGSITWDEMQQICKHDTTDALLILRKATSHDSIVGQFVNDQYTYFYQIINATKWAFYEPFTYQYTEDYDFSDTILVVYADKWLFEKDLDAGDMLYKACYRTGEYVGQRLCPTWSDDVPRFYYTSPGRDMREAASYVRKNQWLDAAMIWNRISESPKRRIAAKASLNLALAYERDDVLDQAMLWITYADSLNRNRLTLKYKKNLEERLKEKKLLDRQMTGN
jgi:hypothetical protein